MIKEKIRKDLTAAMKDRQELRVSTLRMMLAELVNKEKEKGDPVTEDAAVQVFFSMIKKREDAATQFEAVGRKDVAEKEREEIVIIRAYMPAQLTDDEIRTEAREVIAQTGVTDLKGLGKVMGILSKKLSGKASGGDMSRIVKEELEKAH
jgi:uncharacterized protein YqeY